MTSRISAGSFVIAEVCRVRNGRDCVVLLQGVYLLYVCKLAEGVACGVVDIYVQLVGQAETAAAGGIGERTGGGVDVEERPQQYKRRPRKQTENSVMMIPARGASFRFSGAGAALTGARIGIGFLTGRAAAVRSRLRQR